jgi:hypothetical protein
MRRPLIGFFWQLCLLMIAAGSEFLDFTVEIDSDPATMTESLCQGKRRSCSSLVRPLISRTKFELFGDPLEGWRTDDICQ